MHEVVDFFESINDSFSPLSVEDFEGSFDKWETAIIEANDKLVKYKDLKDENKTLREKVKSLKAANGNLQITLDAYKGEHDAPADYADEDRE